MKGGEFADNYPSDFTSSPVQTLIFFADRSLNDLIFLLSHRFPLLSVPSSIPRVSLSVSKTEALSSALLRSFVLLGALAHHFPALPLSSSPSSSLFPLALSLSCSATRALLYASPPAVRIIARSVHFP
jgi:hypothetical protein